MRFEHMTCDEERIVLSAGSILAVENSEVHATVSGSIESVKNPICGEIRADEIGELILETDRIDPSRTKIICR